ncbi:hypothetical protein [Deminuibacter soli]|uniref:Uncharacterized protein n=1 Tax=Deminuibacter soli TaxID=2291815 RepID=A0A3E1NKY8_9BACT|nr:hypothetical protein [Deminuibacter soli]RFM28567.1 hypothetical protein DXN05_07130 [Deminuibacter soli]
MSNDIEEIKEKDIRYNRVSSSRFLFYVQVFCILAFVLGSCAQLYRSHYQGKPDIEVQGSTKYVPEYK